MKKSPTTLNVPIVYFSIKRTPKQPLRRVDICIEKHRIFFGVNWKVHFRDLSDQTIEQVNQILDEHNGRYNDNYGHKQKHQNLVEEDFNITFNTDDAHKVFECVFPQEGLNQRIKESRERERIRFLTRFMKLYEKWSHKVSRQMEIEDQKRELEVEEREMNRRAVFGHSSGRNPSSSRQIYGKRAGPTNATNSRFFPMHSPEEVSQSASNKNGSKFYSTSASTSYNRKKIKPKTKMEKLKEKVLGRALQRQPESFSEDEDNERLPMQVEDPQSKPEGVPSVEDAEETDEENVPDAVINRKKRGLVSKGSRLKKARIEDEDEDSDIEFESKEYFKNNVSGFDDDDDDDVDDNKALDLNEHGDVIPREFPKKTEYTSVGALKIKPSTVTPTRNPSSKLQSKVNEVIDGTITDEETINIDGNQTESPTVNKPSKAPSLESFFGNVPIRSKKLNIVNQSRATSEGNGSLADAALSAKSSGVSPLRMKHIQSSLPSPSTVKNPYKKSNIPPTGHVGLRNLGNTCYLNSSLQVLFSIPGILNDLSTTYQNLSIVNEGDCSNENETMPLCSALLTVASRLRLIPPRIKVNAIRDGPAYPSILKKEMDKLTEKFKGYEQRDAHEFISDLIDLLHDELLTAKREKKNSSHQLPTDKYFRLDVDVCLTCDSCNYSRSKEELYRHLSIDIGKNAEDRPWTVDQGLKQFFQPEQREIKCEKCDSGFSATQTITVKSRPKALLLHLKRFIVEQKNEEVTWRKSTERFKSEPRVSLEPFTFGEEKDDEKKGYRLQGVVRHIGKNAISGHYTADTQRKLPPGQKTQWVNFDDGTPSLTSIERILEDERNQRNNYMMIYGR